VYARVVVANKDMDPELICLSKRNKSDGFGDIKVRVHFSRSKCQISFDCLTMLL
jgi:hypothetical protein